MLSPQRVRIGRQRGWVARSAVEPAVMGGRNRFPELLRKPDQSFRQPFGNADFDEHAFDHFAVIVARKVTREMLKKSELLSQQKSLGTGRQGNFTSPIWRVFFQKEIVGQCLFERVAEDRHELPLIGIARRDIQAARVTEVTVKTNRPLRAMQIFQIVTRWIDPLMLVNIMRN